MKKTEWLTVFRTISLALLTFIVNGCLGEDTFTSSLMTDSGRLIREAIPVTDTSDLRPGGHVKLMALEGTEREGEMTVTGYCWYDEPAGNPPLEALYKWYAVNADRLCPVGWHLLPDEEFEVLGSLHEMNRSETETLGNQYIQPAPMRLPAEMRKRGREQVTKLSCNLPEGCHINTSQPDLRPVNGYQVSSSANYESHNATLRYLNFYESGPAKKNGFGIYAFSVRCMKN